MPCVLTAENLAARVCHSMGLAPDDHAEALAEMLRPALRATASAAIAATRAVCLEIAEDEAERCRALGVTAAQQTALNIAARVQRREVLPGV